MSVRFYLEQFERLKRRGVAAYRAGDREAARTQFLRAAEFLFKAAQGADGKVRTARVEHAHKMVELARRVREHKETETTVRKAEETTPAPEPAAKPAAGGIRFDDIAGLDDVKEQIRIKMIYPFLYPEKAVKYRIRSGGGVLLYGPPGTGKTMIGRAVANELDAPFFAISPADILNKWVGESEKNVAKLFETARESSRAVVFIDEVEALTPRRREAESGGVMQRVVPQILGELDGVNRKEGSSLLFLGATNEPWSIDSAILRPGRLDEKVYVGLPDPAARRKILDLNLGGVPLAGDVGLDALADRLDGYTGADVAYLCRKVCETTFREAVKGGEERPISRADFDAVLGWLKPSVSRKDLDTFARFQKEGS